MTDQATDLAMMEEAPRTRRRPRTEFAVYFGIIFLATLPLATLTWAMRALRSMEWPEKGPVARAWTQARLITPMIFAA